MIPNCLVRPSVGLAFMLASTASYAQDSPSKAPSSYRFKGDAFYAGAGAGLIADQQTATMNARVLGVMGVAEWAMVEGMLFANHFGTEDHHGETMKSTGL